MSNNGKEGEHLFAQIMQQRGYIVNDVSNTPEFWYKDIDFFCTNPATGNTKSFEVKWDTRIHSTGNLYLERTSTYTKQPGIEGKGWFEWCQADFLVYGDAINRKFYVIPMEQLRERANNLPYKSARCGSDSTGQLVALKDITDITYEL